MRQIEPLGQEQASQPSPVDQNRQRVADILELEQAELQAAIDDGDGWEGFHAAEIALLAEMSERVSYLIFIHGVEETVDAAFVHEVIDFLNATDYDRSHTEGRFFREVLVTRDYDAITDATVSRETEAGHIQTAVDNLRGRNAGLSEAA